MKKTILYLAVIALLAGGGYGLYRYFQPAENIARKKAELVITAADLVHAFTTDATSANTSYTGKVIAIRGTVETMESPTSIIFSTGDNYIISFQFNEPVTTTYKEGDTLVIKGQYNGYLEPDAMFDMPGNIQISQCVIQ